MTWAQLISAEVVARPAQIPKANSSKDPSFVCSSDASSSSSPLYHCPCCLVPARGPGRHVLARAAATHLVTHARHPCCFNSSSCIPDPSQTWYSCPELGAEAGLAVGRGLGRSRGNAQVRRSWGGILRFPPFYRPEDLLCLHPHLLQHTEATTQLQVPPPRYRLAFHDFETDQVRHHSQRKVRDGGWAAHATCKAGVTLHINLLPQPLARRFE